MFGKILYIGDNNAKVELGPNITTNIMNMHVIFEDNNKKVLGEIDDIDGYQVSIRFLSEIVNNKIVGGVLNKPTLDATVRIIDESEIPIITGEKTDTTMLLGTSPYYNGHQIYIDVNEMFSNHFAIFGNTGSGKSCGVSRILQNLYSDRELFPFRSNIILFDASGEYYNALKDIHNINPNYNFKLFTTNYGAEGSEQLKLPVWLLNVTDLTLLLNCNNHSQIAIIERMIKLARIFAQNGDEATKYKDHLIAKAIMSILYSSGTAPAKRDEIFSILNSCSTENFNSEATVPGIGYTRKFRECFLVDSTGQFSEIILLSEYVSGFVKNEYDNYEPRGEAFYSLSDLEKALNFTLISEGWLRNENTYSDSVTIKVRLHSLIIGDYAKYFEYNTPINMQQYITGLLINNNKKYQIVNINLEDVDDDFAKVLTKIYSRMLFEFSKDVPNRASIPIHIIVEEAHRYIQNDNDRYLIGYNIFERIAKEGRKYGMILGLISQRPVELSDTVISQCSNFLIFKMNHPVDLEYIRKMVPNINDEIIEKQKALQSGTCLGFGSAFKIPLIVKMQMPNPSPRSSNCDIVRTWKA